MKEFLYFVLGAMVGATLSLLFAPESGTDLRAGIQAAASRITGADVEAGSVMVEAEAVDPATRDAIAVEAVEEDVEVA